MARAVTAAKRMIELLQAGGKSIAAVDCRDDGTYRILIGKPLDEATLLGDGPNEWDEVLPVQ